MNPKRRATLNLVASGQLAREQVARDWLFLQRMALGQAIAGAAAVAVVAGALVAPLPLASPLFAVLLTGFAFAAMVDGARGAIDLYVARHALARL
ncbi:MULTISPECIES: hypothetical protein [Brevundimonas]|uniref:Uncharacterized protein n=1 Tax=Brevundimonas nasdae TaxID=172043 RepID=A0A0B4DNT0_9CAUL|nr:MULTISPECIES: hypothetical protein [Brevundimonas]KIC55893.1 hypothetical protein RM53_14350 [Brevundimonas nasdae]RSB43081.1 hypothetical protein EGK63_12795 [Brevundimonas sp. 357]